MNLPIRLRLTLWYSALLAGALLLFSVIIYLVMAQALVGNLDTSLRDRIRAVQVEVKKVSGRLTIPGGEEQTDEPAVPVILLTPSGRILRGGAPPSVSLWLRRHHSRLRPGLNLYGAGTVRLATSPVNVHGHLAGYVLAWQSTKSADAAKHSLLVVLLAAGVAFLAVAGLGGLALARRALEPVAHLTQAASAISATDLRRRVQVGSARDELSELAATFNAMIDRLEAAVERERRFTADASHELRSPLAVIRAEATLALDHPRPASEYRQALATVDEQAAAMEDLSGALLMLARVEASPAVEGESVNVAYLVTSAIEQARPSVPGPDVTIDCQIPGDLAVAGSPPLLTRAVRTVIENAIKVSRAGDTIHMHAAQEGDQVALTIKDEGPGIDAGQQERIFEPFYQVTSARTPGDSHGLGLAICRRIVTAHGGNVAVESRPGQGACFRIVLPIQHLR
jgi:signal transduction histidine kinase